MCSKLRYRSSDTTSRLKSELEQALLQKDPNIFSYGLSSQLAQACAGALECA